MPNDPYNKARAQSRARERRSAGRAAGTAAAVRGALGIGGGGRATLSRPTGLVRERMESRRRLRARGPTAAGFRRL